MVFGRFDQNSESRGLEMDQTGFQPRCVRVAGWSPDFHGQRVWIGEGAKLGLRRGESSDDDIPGEIPGAVGKIPGGIQ